MYSFIAKIFSLHNRRTEGKATASAFMIFGSRAQVFSLPSYLAGTIFDCEISF